jgi:hypothetical protein
VVRVWVSWNRARWRRHGVMSDKSSLVEVATFEDLSRLAWAASVARCSNRASKIANEKTNVASCVGNLVGRSDLPPDHMILS